MQSGQWVHLEMEVPSAFEKKERFALTSMDTGSCQASCIDRVYMCWQIGIDIGVSISIGADVYTNSNTLGGTVFSEAVPLFFLCF